MTTNGKFILLGLGLYTCSCIQKTASNLLPAPNNAITDTLINNLNPPLVTIPAGITTPGNLWIGQSGNKYGSNYFALLNEMPGESAFYWYGYSNGNAYPESGYGANGYQECFFPSHSVNVVNGNAKPGVIGFIEYRIFAPNGNLIAYVKDTKGGYHPNYEANLRGNNHPDFTNRYLPIGSGYRIVFKNISTNRAAVMTFDVFGAKTLLYPDSTADVQFSVTDWANVGDPIPKINCNIEQ